MRPRVVSRRRSCRSFAAKRRTSAMGTCRARAAATLLGAAIAGCATTAAPPLEPSAAVAVKILAFNDFHGHLQSPGRFGNSAQTPQRPAVGGADALAAHVARLRARNPNSVVVAAG